MSNGREFLSAAVGFFTFSMAGGHSRARFRPGRAATTHAVPPTGDFSGVGQGGLRCGPFQGASGRFTDQLFHLRPSTRIGDIVFG